MAQALGALAKLLWHGGATNADVVGFLYVGGDIAGIFSYFFFVLFGALLVYRHAGFFWRSLHPLNFGLAMLLFSAPRVLGGAPAAAVGFALWALLGAGLAAVCARFVAAHPRRWLLAAGGALFALALLRYAAPAEWRMQFYGWRSFARPLAGLCGGFLFALPIALFVRRGKAAGLSD